MSNIVIPDDFYPNLIDSDLRERMFTLNLDPFSVTHRLQIYDKRGNLLSPYFFPAEVSDIPQYNVTFDTTSMHMYETETLYFAQGPDPESNSYVEDRDERPAKFTVPLQVNIQTDKIDIIDYSAIDYLISINPNTKITDTLNYSSSFFYFEWLDNPDDSIGSIAKNDEINLFGIEPNKKFNSLNTKFDNLPELRTILPPMAVENNINLTNLYGFLLNENDKTYEERKFSAYENLNVYLHSKDREGEFGRMLRISVAKRLEIEFMEESTGRLVRDSIVFYYPVATIYFYGEIIGYDDRLGLHLRNKGWDLIKDLNVYRDYANDDDVDDLIFKNAKEKELILYGEEIFPYIGSYRALFNVLDHLGWDELKIEEQYIDLQQSNNESLKFLRVNPETISANPKLQNQINSGTLVSSGGLTFNFPTNVDRLPNDDITYPSTNSSNLPQNGTTNSPSRSFIPPPVKTYAEIVAEKKEEERKTQDKSKIFSPNPDQNNQTELTQAEIIAKLNGLKNLLQDSFLPFNVKITDINSQIIKFSVNILRAWGTQNTIVKVGADNSPKFKAVPVENNISNLSDFLTRSLDLLGLQYYNLKPSDILSKTSACYYSLGDINYRPKISSIVPNSYRPVYEDSEVLLFGKNLCKKFYDGFTVNTPTKIFYVHLTKNGNFNFTLNPESGKNYINSNWYRLANNDYFLQVNQNNKIYVNNVNQHNYEKNIDLNGVRFKMYDSYDIASIELNLNGLVRAPLDKNLIPVDRPLDYQWSIKNITNNGAIVTAREYNFDISGATYADSLVLLSDSGNFWYEIYIDKNGALVTLDITTLAPKPANNGLYYTEYNKVIRCTDNGTLYTEQYVYNVNNNFIEVPVAFIFNLKIKYENSVEVKVFKDETLYTSDVTSSQNDINFYYIKTYNSSICKFSGSRKIYKLYADRYGFLHTETVPLVNTVYENYANYPFELIKDGYSIKIDPQSGALITTTLNDLINFNELSAEAYIKILPFDDGKIVLESDNAKKYELWFNPGTSSFESAPVSEDYDLTEDFFVLQASSPNKLCYRLTVDNVGTPITVKELNTTPFNFFWINTGPLATNTVPYAVYVDALGNYKGVPYGNSLEEIYTPILESHNGYRYKLNVESDGALSTTLICSSVHGIRVSNLLFIDSNGFEWKLNVTDSGHLMTSLTGRSGFNCFTSHLIFELDSTDQVWSLSVSTDGALNTYNRTFASLDISFNSNSIIYPYSRIENDKGPVWTKNVTDNGVVQELPFEPTTYESDKFYAIARPDRAIAWFSLYNSRLEEYPPVIFKIRELTKNKLEIVSVNFDETNFTENYDIYINFNGSEIASPAIYSINSRGNIEIDLSENNFTDGLTGLYDKKRIKIHFLQKYLFGASTVPAQMFFSQIRSMTPQRFFQHPGFRFNLNVELLDQIVLTLFDQIGIPVPEPDKIVPLNVITEHFIRILDYIRQFIPFDVATDINVSNLELLGSFTMLELDDDPYRIKDLNFKIKTFRSNLDANPADDNGALPYFRIRDLASKYKNKKIRWRIQHSEREWQHLSEFSTIPNDRRYNGRYVVFVPYSGFYHALVEVDEGNGEINWSAKWRAFNIFEQKADFNAIGIGQFKDLRLGEINPSVKIRNAGFLPNGNMPLIKSTIRDNAMPISAWDRANYMHDNQYYKSDFIKEFPIAYVNVNDNIIEFIGTDLVEEIERRKKEYGEEPSNVLTFDYENYDSTINDVPIYDILSITQSNSYMRGSNLRSKSVRTDDTVGLQELKSQKNSIVEVGWTNDPYRSSLDYGIVHRFFTSEFKVAQHLVEFSDNNSYYYRVRYHNSDGIHTHWHNGKPYASNDTKGALIRQNSSLQTIEFNPNIEINQYGTLLKINTDAETSDTTYFLYEIYIDTNYNFPYQQLLSNNNNVIVHGIPMHIPIHVRVGKKLNTGFNDYRYIWSPILTLNSSLSNKSLPALCWLVNIVNAGAPAALNTSIGYADDILKNYNYYINDANEKTYRLTVAPDGALITTLVETIFNAPNLYVFSGAYMMCDVDGTLRTLETYEEAEVQLNIIRSHTLYDYMVLDANNLFLPEIDNYAAYPYYSNIIVQLGKFYSHKIEFFVGQRIFTDKYDPIHIRCKITRIDSQKVYHVSIHSNLIVGENYIVEFDAPLDGGEYLVEFTVSNSFGIFSEYSTYSYTMHIDFDKIFEDNFIIESIDINGNVIFNNYTVQSHGTPERYFVELYVDQEKTQKLIKKSSETPSILMWEINSILAKSEYMYLQASVLMSDGTIVRSSLTSVKNEINERQPDLITVNLNEHKAHTPRVHFNFNQNNLTLNFEPTIAIIISKYSNQAQLTYVHADSFYHNISEESFDIKFKQISGNEQSAWTNYITFNLEKIKYRNLNVKPTKIEFDEIKKSIYISFDALTTNRTIHLILSTDVKFLNNTTYLTFNLNAGDTSIRVPAYYLDVNSLYFLRFWSLYDYELPVVISDFYEVIVPNYLIEPNSLNNFAGRASVGQGNSNYLELTYEHAIGDNGTYEVEISNDPYFKKPVIDPFTSLIYDKAFELQSNYSFDYAQNQSLYIDNPTVLSNRIEEFFYGLDYLYFYMQLNDSTRKNIWRMFVESDGSLHTQLLLDSYLKIESASDSRIAEIRATKNGALTTRTTNKLPDYSTRSSDSDTLFEIIADEEGTLITVPYYENIDNSINIIENIVLESTDKNRWLVTINRQGALITKKIDPVDYYRYPVVQYFAPLNSFTSGRYFDVRVENDGALTTVRVSAFNPTRTIIRSVKSYKSIALRHSEPSNAWKISATNHGELFIEMIDFSTSIQKSIVYDTKHEVIIDYNKNLKLIESKNERENAEPIILKSPNNSIWKLTFDLNSNPYLTPLNADFYPAHIARDFFTIADSGNYTLWSIGIDDFNRIHTYPVNNIIDYEVYDQYPILSIDQKHVWSMKVRKNGTLYTEEFLTNSVSNVYIETERYVMNDADSKSWNFYIDYDGAIHTQPYINSNGTKYNYFKVHNTEEYYKIDIESDGTVRTVNATKDIYSSYMVRNNTIIFWNTDFMSALQVFDAVTILTNKFKHENLRIDRMQIDSTVFPTRAVLEFNSDPVHTLRENGKYIEKVMTYADGFHVKTEGNSNYVEFIFDKFQLVNYPNYAIALDPQYNNIFKPNDIITVRFEKINKKTQENLLKFDVNMKILRTDAERYFNSEKIKNVQIYVDDNLRIARYADFEINDYIQPYILNNQRTQLYNLDIDNTIDRNIVINPGATSNIATTEDVIMFDANGNFWKLYVENQKIKSVRTTSTNINYPIFSHKPETLYTRIRVLNDGALFTEISNVESDSYTAYKFIKSVDGSTFRLEINDDMSLQTSKVEYIAGNEYYVRSDNQNVWKVFCETDGTLRTELVIDVPENILTVDAIYFEKTYEINYWTLDVLTDGKVIAIPYDITFIENIIYKKTLRLKLHKIYDAERIDYLRTYHNLKPKYSLFLNKTNYYDFDTFFERPKDFILSEPESYYRSNYEIDFIKIQNPSDYAQYSGKIINNKLNTFVQFKPNANKNLFPIDTRALNYYESFAVDERQSNFRINNLKIEQLSKLRLEDLRFYRVNTIAQLMPPEKEFFSIIAPMKNTIILFNRRYRFPIYVEKNDTSLESIINQFKNPYKNYRRYNEENYENPISRKEIDKIVEYLSRLEIRVDYLRDFSFNTERYAITFVLPSGISAIRRIETLDRGIIFNPIHRGVQEFRFKFNNIDDGLEFYDKKGRQIATHRVRSTNYVEDVKNSSIPLLEKFLFTQQEDGWINARAKNVKFFDVRTLLPASNIRLNYNYGEINIIQIERGQKIQFGLSEWSSINIINPLNLNEIKDNLVEFFRNFKEYEVEITIDRTIDNYECVNIQIIDYDNEDTLINEINEIRGLRTAEIDTSYRNFIDRKTFYDINKKNLYRANALNNSFCINNQTRVNPGSIVTFISDKGTVSNPKKYHWRIFHGKTNNLVYRSFSRYMNYMFDEPGYYSIELNIEDANGNSYVCRKNDWLIVENNVQFN